MAEVIVVPVAKLRISKDGEDDKVVYPCHPGGWAAEGWTVHPPVIPDEEGGTDDPGEDDPPGKGGGGNQGGGGPGQGGGGGHGKPQKPNQKPTVELPGGTGEVVPADLLLI